MTDAITLFNRRFPDSARALDFVLRRDRRRFLFATTSSISGRRLLRAYGLDRRPHTQPVLLDGGEAYRGTRARLSQPVEPSAPGSPQSAPKKVSAALFLAR